MTIQDLKTQISDIKNQLTEDNTSAEETKTKYLGKKGLFNTLAKSITDINPQDRKKAGEILNQFKQELEEKLKTKKTKHQTTIDLTIPGIKPNVGHMHPVSQAIEEVTKIFTKIGFTRVRYPEADWDWYAFESLNMPPTHPARDEWETFFISDPLFSNNNEEKRAGMKNPANGADISIHNFSSDNVEKSVGTQNPANGVDITQSKLDSVQYDPNNPRKRHPSLIGGKLVMTPHTSNGQVREMERLSQPPIRMINIARCYRRQQDATHTQMFHQFEGLVVDKGINIQHLKGTLDYFAEHFYGPGTKSRIRPFHFQFTEPSFEVDFSCHICGGTGIKDGDKCKFCKSGWHEVGGAGMVHPNVLKAGGIDPDKYTGFAFGWGIERTYTLKEGLNIDDIRLLYSADLRFLRQF